VRKEAGNLATTQSESVACFVKNCIQCANRAFRSCKPCRFAPVELSADSLAELQQTETFL
jgi:hypothetical protein